MQAQAKLSHVLPMALDLCMVNGNHWDMSYGMFPAGLTLGSKQLRHPFPKRAAMEAMVHLVGELGIAD
jgi:hypothetical protein